MNQFFRLLTSLGALLPICLTAQTTLPIDFESGTVAADFTDFDGATADVVANPYPDALNESPTVGRIVREGGQIWAGSYLALDAPFDFSEENAIRMKIWSPRSGVRMKVKLENAEGLSTEVDQWNVTSGGWETMTWDFALALPMTFDRLLFMFDFETIGDGTDDSTFYFDDIEQVDPSAGLAQIDLPVTFEEEGVFYATMDFWGNASEVVADPENPANQVVQVTKMETAMTWAGTIIGTLEGFATPIPFTETDQTISIRVHTPAAGTPILLKAEMSGNPIATETLQFSSQAGWETLQFNLGNEMPGTEPLQVGFPYDLLAIFFGFGEPGVEGGTTYYFDDVYFGQQPAVSVEAPTAANWTCYPNPLRAGQMLQLDGLNEGEHVAIWDAAGREVWSGAYQAAGLDMTLKAGAYFVVANGRRAERLLVQ